MTGGLILAGGASRRMGRPKAFLEYRGETFLGRLQRIFLEATDPFVVVLGHDADIIRPLLDPRAIPAVNPDPERGMLTSLQAGLLKLPNAEHILFVPLDYPAIQQETIKRLCAASHSAASPAKVVMPRYQGRRGHPVLISQDVARRLLDLPPAGAAHDVIRSYNDEIVYVDVNDPAILMDVDTPEDYEALSRL